MDLLGLLLIPAANLLRYFWIERFIVGQIDEVSLDLYDAVEFAGPGQQVVRFAGYSIH